MLVVTMYAYACLCVLLYVHVHVHVSNLGAVRRTSTPKQGFGVIEVQLCQT